MARGHHQNYLVVHELFPPYERRSHISQQTFDVLTACLSIPAERPASDFWVWQYVYERGGEYALRTSPLKMQVFYMARLEARRMGLEHSRDVNMRIWHAVFDFCRKAQFRRNNCEFWMQRSVFQGILRRSPREILIYLAQKENEKNQFCFMDWEIENLIRSWVQHWLEKCNRSRRYAT